LSGADCEHIIANLDASTALCGLALVERRFDVTGCRKPIERGQT
jgi:hypothetical protein